MDLIARLSGKGAVTVANKSDLPFIAEPSVVPSKAVRASMITGEGLDVLRERMVEVALNGKSLGSGEVLVSNARHKAALESTATHLVSAERALTQGLPDDFVTIDLTSALTALGEITGETVN